MTLHIVWDWNGTLLDDLDLVVSSVSASVGRLGRGPITATDYRDHYTRPVRKFYDSLFGRPVGDMEWADLNKTFHDSYYAAVDTTALTFDARPTLEGVVARGWGQSLLSMSTHSYLLSTVRAHGIDHFFTRITGLTEANGDLKAPHLAKHLDDQGIDSGSTVVIGDTPDDHHAAVAVGARSILYDGGSHHLRVLDAAGVPVAATLGEALTILDSEIG